MILRSFSWTRKARVAFALSLSVLSTATVGQPGPGTSDNLEVAAAFDRAISPLMEKWRVPGLSLAVARDGKVVFAKGYGFADVDKATPMSKSTLLRMGSINKTLTAAAVMKLVELKKLNLDSPVMPFLIRAGVAPEMVADPRALDITLRHLLQHSAGFDRQSSGDPFFQPRLWEVARRQGVAPVTCEAIIRDALSLPLDFQPGTRYAYSNLGYCILGVVVRVVADEPFQRFVNRELLEPSIGKSYLAGKSQSSMPSESTYYMPSDAPREKVAPGLNGLFGVQAPYGSFSIENMEALGAWVATPIDVLKFFLALDGTRGPALLSSDSLNQMRESPRYAMAKDQRSIRYYGLGLEVRQTERGPNWWHGGSQPGLQSLALRTSEGFSWVFVINTRPTESSRGSFLSDFDRAMWSAARSVRNWPGKDAAE